MRASVKMEQSCGSSRGFVSEVEGCGVFIVAFRQGMHPTRRGRQVGGGPRDGDLIERGAAQRTFGKLRSPCSRSGRVTFGPTAEEELAQLSTSGADVARERIQRRRQVNIGNGFDSASKCFASAVWIGFDFDCAEENGVDRLGLPCCLERVRCGEAGVGGLGDLLGFVAARLALGHRMRAGSSAAQGRHQQVGQHYQSEANHSLHRLTVSKRSVYGTTVIFEKVTAFSVLELPEATARPM